MTRLPLAIDPHHPAFEGHFPSRPVVPGVVLLDCSLRAIARYRGDDTCAGCVRIGVAKFLSIVGPGELLRLEIEATSTAGQSDGYRLWIFAGPAAGERLALTGNVSFESPPPHAPQASG